MDRITKVSLFFKETLARITGDTSATIASKNARTSSAALDVQISTLNAILNKKINEVENCKERLEEAKYPTDLISNDDVYIGAIQTAKNNLIKAEEDVATTQNSLDYFTKLKTEMFSEVAR